ncbi:protein of unknown function [Denitratisoma oestradiolicum]|uniref:Uncharacterized protein n=1 Tax=Denitratisoma oestradiolicum TaxID=311182 RepID=A0A6S6XTK0_9PROT|nr:protein of unknown function [Denitratisoma oestradiolicum]
MRGTRTGHCRHLSRRRFIPAHAGNTYGAGASNGAGTVHPRACGEHQSSGRRAGAADGSSPRMRGTHRNLFVGDLDNRFIPAHAGNT